MKDKITLTVDIPTLDLMETVEKELAPDMGGSDRPSATTVALFGIARELTKARHSDAVNRAIDHVIRATEKFDRDQYTKGQASAATALFEAGKRLRAAIAEEKKARTEKGTFHV